MEKQTPLVRCGEACFYDSAYSCQKLNFNASCLLSKAGRSDIFSYLTSTTGRQSRSFTSDNVVVFVDNQLIYGFPSLIPQLGGLYSDTMSHPLPYGADTFIHEEERPTYIVWASTRRVRLYLLNKQSPPLTIRGPSTWQALSIFEVATSIG